MLKGSPVGAIAPVLPPDGRFIVPVPPTATASVFTMNVNGQYGQYSQSEIFHSYLNRTKFRPLPAYFQPQPNSIRKVSVLLSNAYLVIGVSVLFYAKLLSLVESTKWKSI